MHFHGFYCTRRCGPRWELALLQRWAGGLQELQLDYLTQDLVRAVEAMPGLRKLTFYDARADTESTVSCVLPAAGTLARCPGREGSRQQVLLLYAVRPSGQHGVG